MPALRTHIRRSNGNYRKQPYRKCQQEYRITRGLTTNEINLRLCFQTEMLSATLVRRSIANYVSIILTEHHNTDDEEERNLLLEQASTIFSLDLNLIYQIYNYYNRQESILCDIDPNIDDTHEYGAPRNRRIQDLSDYDCHRFTRFTQSQLLRMYHYFRIDPVLRIHNHGDRHYAFTGEEILLFSLSKIALGLNNQVLCMFIFGGCARRWSAAYKWFLFHLYDRYYPTIIGFNGLEREVQNFPYYATKIARKFNQERFYLENDTYEKVEVQSTTIPDDDFVIAMFIDGNVTETSTCETGPNGDYSGTMRKNDYDIMQKSIYSGYKKQHGLSTLTLFLPNGINYIYGPCSMRENDRWLVNRSRCNGFLMDIQNNTPSLEGRLYAAYGDKLFQNFECIRRAHAGDALNPLPRNLVLENNGMNAVRISIEHGYGEVANSFKICTRFDEQKLHAEQPYAREQLVACYLLSNILNTFNGSQVTGDETYFCNCPSFEEYIELGDEDEM